MMNFPVELTLRTTEDGIRMFAEPVREIELLHAKRHAWSDRTLGNGGDNLLEGITGDLFHVRADLQVGTARGVGLAIRGVPVVYNAGKWELACKGCRAPLAAEDGTVRLETLVDRTSIEVFAHRGRVYMPVGVIPPDEDRSLSVFAKGGSAKAKSLRVYELKSAWQ